MTFWVSRSGVQSIRLRSEPALNRVEGQARLPMRRLLFVLGEHVPGAFNSPATLSFPSVEYSSLSLFLPREHILLL